MTKIRANQTEVEEILNDPLAGATETKKGTVEIATQVEVDLGTDTERSITPATLKNFTGTFEPVDPTILKDADIGVTVQGYDATILNDADIGVNIEAFITKNTAFNLNFGTIAGTVSEGNHTHTLDNLTDVVIGGSPLLTGHTLTYDGANWINQTPASGITNHLLLSNIGTNTHAQIDTHISDTTVHFTTLDGLSDVIVAGSPAVTNQVLTFNGTNWVNADVPPGGSVALNDLTDVTLGSPITNQVLTFDGTNWVNAAGGGTTNNWLTANNDTDFTTAPISTGSNSIAIGDAATTAATTDTVAIGTTATVSSNNGVAIGRVAEAAALHVVAVGYGAIGRASSDIVIGKGSNTGTFGAQSIAIGHIASIPGFVNNSIAIGTQAQAEEANQVSIGPYLTSADITRTDVAHSVKIGSGNAANRNVLHLFSKGKLELYGEEAQYIFPSYAVTGSPFETPANSVEAGVIYDSTAQALQLYNGTSWSAIGGSVALNDLTDVVIGGSPLLTGHTLTYDGTNWINQTPDSGVIDHLLLSNIGTNTHAQIDTHISDTTVHFSTLDGLSDVIVAGSPAVTNQVLTFNGTNWVNADVPPGGSIALNNLTDVTLGSPVTNEVLTFDGANWVNAAGGGTTNNWLTANNDTDFAADPISTGFNSIAIGDGATTSTFNNAIAIGELATISSTYGISIGRGSEAAQSAIGIGMLGEAKGWYSIAIGRSANCTVGASQAIAIGNNAVAQATGDYSVNVGAKCQASFSYQTNIGYNLRASANPTTTDVSHSVKLGSTKFANVNILHLFSKGKLELYGDEAQYIFPSYAVTGSPIEVPANSVEGGVIYDSVAKGLEIYDGTSWSAIGGGGSVALNDLTDVTLGSPVINEVLTFDGSNWINAGTTGEANKNWLVADNGDNFANPPASVGINSIALGDNASTSTDTNSIAIGTTASTLISGKNIAIGYSARALRGTALALGYNADADGADSIAIGNTALARDPGQVIIGDHATGATSNGINSIAIGTNAVTKYSGAIAIGGNSDAGYSGCVAIGKNAIAGTSGGSARKNTALGAYCEALTYGQIVVGWDVDAGSTTTNLNYAVKIGHGTTGINKNMLHLLEKGKLELVGDEAQYIFPNYAIGSPATYPTNSVEGGVIYDSVAKGLEVYDGTSWSAIGGGAGGGAVALNDLTDVIVAGSPLVTNQVLTYDGSNWINDDSQGEVNQNWIVANNGVDFTNAPSSIQSNSIAIGDNAITTSTSAVAIGDGADADFAGVSIGLDPVSGNSGIAIGRDASADQLSAVAIGHGAVVSGSNSVALGTSATAEAAGVAIGRAVDVGASGVGVGSFITATGAAVVLGSGADCLVTNGIAIGAGAQVTTGSSFESIAIGRLSKAELSWQTVLGQQIDAGSVTTNENFSTKIGYGTPGANLTLMHLMSNGKLELYGDDAQFIFPNYQSGSPLTDAIPTTTIEGGAIWDSTTKELKVYDGTSFSAVGGAGGGGATVLNDLTDVVIGGSPLTTNQVLTYDGANWINDDSQGESNKNWIYANNGADFSTPPVSTGTPSVAIGNFASATGLNAIAVGIGCTATDFNCTSLGFNSDATANSAIAIGDGANAIANDSIVIGNSSTNSTANLRSTTIGRSNIGTKPYQVIIGYGMFNLGTETVDHEALLGSNLAGNVNVLHLFSKGKLELLGDEAQFIFPVYAEGGSPTVVPANAFEGGTIYDSVNKVLRVYDGTSWGDVAPAAAAASTKPTYESIVIAGSPVSDVVTTTVSTVALTGNPLLAGLLVFRNGAQQSEGVMTGSPLQPSEDFAVTGANELTFGTGVLEVGNKINIYVFE